MVDSDDFSYLERMLCFEEDKRNILKNHPEYTYSEYEKAVKQLADKWQI